MPFFTFLTETDKELYQQNIESRELLVQICEMGRVGPEQTNSLTEQVTELEIVIQKSDLFYPILLKSLDFRSTQTSLFSENSNFHPSLPIEHLYICLFVFSATTSYVTPNKQYYKSHIIIHTKTLSLH